jgi:hypothetical protein
MSRYILHQAVVCGGIARGFQQAADAVTCGVYASDWLTDQVNESDHVFARATPQRRSLVKPVPYFSAPDPPEVKGRYKIMSPMPPPPEDNRVVVEICDYQPAKEYVDAATSIKKTWGSMAPQIKIGFTDRLKEQAHLQMGGQAPKFDVSDQPALIELGGDPVDKRATRAELLGYLRQPGINIWSLAALEAGATGHIMATYCTRDKFRIFDSLRGETTMPTVQIDNWFNSEEVTKYLDMYATFSAPSFVTQT